MVRLVLQGRLVEPWLLGSVSQVSLQAAGHHHLLLLLLLALLLLGLLVLACHQGGDELAHVSDLTLILHGQ